MDTSFCKRIDDELLVEQYVKGKLSPEEYENFELHLKECEKHTQAVALEKALHRGISEFARSEIRTHLKRSIRKKESMRFYILRYAAILFFVVITPLMLYYQFYLPPAEPETIVSTDAEAIILEEEKTESQIEHIPVVEERASRQRKETIQAEGLIKKSRASRSEQSSEQLQTPPQTAEDAMEALSSETRIEAEIAPAPAVPGSAVRGLKSKSSFRDVAGSGVDLYKTQSVDLLEEQLRKCIVINQGALNAKEFIVTYSYRVDSTGSAHDVTLVKASEKINSLDSCLQKTIQDWPFKTNETDSLITRTSHFNVD